MIIVIYYYIAIVLQYCPQNPRSTLQVVLCGELLRDSRGRFFCSHRRLRRWAWEAADGYTASEKAIEKW